MLQKTPVRFLAVLAATAALIFPPALSHSQDASSQAPRRLTSGDDFQPITDADIQMMRKDIRSQRKQIIAANMKLTDAEAEKFWPVYEQYISELVQINHAKYDLIKQYVQTGGALTDGEAENAASQWVNVDRSVADLRMKYIPIFRKVLSSKSTALFYQLDRRVQLMIDLQLASSLPLVQP
jgi:Spy/CpxP family protein refolding chaperone